MHYLLYNDVYVANSAILPHFVTCIFVFECSVYSVITSSISMYYHSVCSAQDTGNKVKDRSVSLYVLHRSSEAYNTVDHTFLWQVLTRIIGVPPQIIVVIRQFYDGMKARVRPSDSICSGWFKVEQGLRQGYARYPRCCSTYSSQPH